MQVYISVLTCCPIVYATYHNPKSYVYLQFLFRSLHDYVFCASVRLNKLCGSFRNNHVTAEARRKIEDTFENHSWVCKNGIASSRKEMALFYDKAKKKTKRKGGRNGYHIKFYWLALFFTK